MLAGPRQDGFALLMLLVVFIGIAAIGLSGLLSSSVEQRHQQARDKNIKVLRQAKEALLSYAVNYAVSNNLDKMGKLPCPDVMNVSSFPGDIEGNQDSSCGIKSSNTIGYFPYKTLGVGKLADSSSECLWYVVSGDYKNNPDASILNWDSVGYINIRDENGKLKHQDAEDEYPIALIISPGASLGQNRSADPDMPNCKSNYTIINYLEGGPNIDYATDLPNTAGAMWSFLTTSDAAQLTDADYNDQVIAIYKDELWNRIEKIGDLSFDNSAGVPTTSSIELMTRSLAECLAAFGNNALNLDRQLPYPAPLDLDPSDLDKQEYRDEANYDDAVIRFGRFPQVLDDSGWFTTTNFVLDTAGSSFCENAVTTLYDELFWKNWKDHFFYIVSEDFDPGLPATDPAVKCATANCITVDGKADKVAAMVIFAGPAGPDQDRTWWWDQDNLQVGVDNKKDSGQYLDDGNEEQYTGGNKGYSTAAALDYQYCVEYRGPPGFANYEFVAIKCADLDGVNDAP